MDADADERLRYLNCIELAYERISLCVLLAHTVTMRRNASPNSDLRFNYFLAFDCSCVFPASSEIRTASQIEWKMPLIRSSI